MRFILALAAFSALAGAASAQAPAQRYLTWPGKTEAAPAILAPTAAARLPAQSGGRWQDGAAGLTEGSSGAAGRNTAAPATQPATSDRYGPARAPAAIPTPVAYAPAPRPTAPARPAPAARPTIYDAPAQAPIARRDTAPTLAPSVAPRPVAAPAPAQVAAAPAPPPATAPLPARNAAQPVLAAAAQTPPAAAPAARQPWNAGRGEAQGVPWRRYSVQREATPQEAVALDPAFLAGAQTADMAEPPAVDPWYPPQQQAPAPQPARARGGG